MRQTDGKDASAVSFRRSIDIPTDTFLQAVRVASGATSQDRGQPVDALQVAWGLVGERVERGSARHAGGPPQGVSRYAVRQKGQQLALRNALETHQDDTWLPVNE